VNSKVTNKALMLRKWTAAGPDAKGSLVSVGSAQRRRSVIRRNSYGGNPAGSPKPAGVNDLHKVEEVIEIQRPCLSPSTGTVYGAIDMRWAKLVGQIAQAK
jgi:hypothetical protein